MNAKYINSVSVKIVMALFVFSLSYPVFGQRDTGRRQVVDITSSYKPVLRSISKLSITASQLQADTSKPRLVYAIPSQNLFYTYQPVSLRPLAYEQDSLMQLGIRNYVKLGIGNYSTPLVSAGLGFGDGKISLMNVYADYISSRGRIKYQDYSSLNFRAAGSYFTRQHEVYAIGTFGLNGNYRYGYDHSAYTFAKQDIQQNFMNFSLKAGARNTESNSLGVFYNPSVKVDLFNLKNKATETSVILDIPGWKKIDEDFSAKLGINIDYTSYATKGFSPDRKFSNTVVQLMPSLAYTQPKFTVNAGIIPVASNNKFVLLPDIYGEAKLQGKSFLLQAGLVGKVIKNTFHHLSDVNPYLDPVVAQENTRETELYGGIKSTLGKHFSFSAKAGFVYYKDMLLYLNDTVSFHTFSVGYEPDATGMRLHGDISYVNRNDFSFTAGITINGYSGLSVNKYAWGMLPMELNASLRWKFTDAILLRSDLYVFGGGPYRTKGNGYKNLNTAADLSFGADYTINKKFTAWLQLNNVFNDRYQRWHNYEVYGINFLIGAKYSF